MNHQYQLTHCVCKSNSIVFLTMTTVYCDPNSQMRLIMPYLTLFHFLIINPLNFTIFPVFFFTKNINFQSQIHKMQGNEKKKKRNLNNIIMYVCRYISAYRSFIKTENLFMKALS